MEKKKVAVFLANGFEEIEAVTPIDLLQRAGINVDTVSITKDNLVESARRMKILADKIIDDIDFSLLHTHWHIRYVLISCFPPIFSSLQSFPSYEYF